MDTMVQFGPERRLVGATASGWLGDRVGPRRTLFVCGLIWASATILTGFAGTLTALFLVRLMLASARARRSPSRRARCRPGRRRGAVASPRELRMRARASATR